MKISSGTRMQHPNLINHSYRLFLNANFVNHNADNFCKRNDILLNSSANTTSLYFAQTCQNWFLLAVPQKFPHPTYARFRPVLAARLTIYRPIIHVQFYGTVDIRSSLMLQNKNAFSPVQILTTKIRHKPLTVQNKLASLPTMLLGQSVIGLSKISKFYIHKDF